MQPMTPERYRAHVAGMAEIMTQCQAEDPSLVGEKLVNEIHEWLSAPDSFFHWHGGDETTTESIALDTLRFSANRHAGASEGRGSGVVTDGEVNYEFLAAWAFVTDVVDLLTAETTPDLTDRDALIAWLVANDPNGCHSDDETLLEFGRTHTLESALACYRSVMDLDEE